MKRIIDWYSMLPEPVKSQAFENAIACNERDIFNYEVRTMYSAINLGFSWDATRQGAEYWILVSNNWNDVTNTLKVPVTYSSSMRKMLISMKHESIIAKALLMDSATTSEFANYITMRGELCSYLPNGREHIVNEDGKWARNGRQDMKVAKMARNLINESTLNNIDVIEFEKFSNIVKAYISVLGDEDGNGKKISFEVINGRKIYDAYLGDNYSMVLGNDTNLCNSCMRHEEAQGYLDLYVDNVEVVSLLVAYDTNNKVLGRAILWVLHDGKKAMDTIYAHDSLTASFIQWAHDNDCYYKSRQSCHHAEFDKHLNGRYVCNPCVILKNYDYNEYPYMDTLSILEDNQLRNENKTNEYKILKSTDGGYEDVNTNVYDVYNNCDVDEDDARYVNYCRPDGNHIQGHVHIDDVTDIADIGWVLSCDCIDIDGAEYLRDDENICYLDMHYENEWYLIADCVTDFDGEFIHKDDAVTLCIDVYDHIYAHKDDATKCAIDGLYYLNDDMISLDGQMFYEINLITKIINDETPIN